MPAKTEKQANAFGIALAARRGKIEPEELLGVRHFLQRLDPHPTGKALEVHRLEVGRHRPIQIGRKRLSVELLVTGGLDLLFQHR